MLKTLLCPLLLALLPQVGLAARREQHALPGQDCNRNGIEDSVDIAFGTSSDVNGNGVPDECEKLGRAQPGGQEPPFCGRIGIRGIGWKEWGPGSSGTLRRTYSVHVRGMS